MPDAVIRKSPGESAVFSVLAVKTADHFMKSLFSQPVIKRCKKQCAAGIRVSGHLPVPRTPKKGSLLMRVARPFATETCGYYHSLSLWRNQGACHPVFRLQESRRK